MELKRLSNDRRWQFAALILLAVLAYLNALPNGFIWDDDHYVLNNVTLRSFDGLRRLWFELRATPQYYPLVHSSFWLEYQTWGLNPLGFHVTNVLLHGVAASLFFLSLKTLRIPGAWLAAAIFAVHPACVESVAWVTERKNVLSAVFYFLSFLAFAKAIHWNEDEDRKPNWRAYATSLCLFVCALLSKTVVCSLPAAILLLLWYRSQKWSRRDRRDALLLLPFFAVGLAMAAMTVWLERTHVGAEGMEWNFSFVERCLIAGRSLLFYAGKILWPEPLIFFYERWVIDASLWWQYLFPLGFLAILITSIALHKRFGRGLPVAIMIFAGTLLPALGFFNVYPHRYSFVADHFQYLAIPSFIALSIAGIHALLNRGKAERTSVPIIGGTLLLAVFIVMSNQRSTAYRNEEALWVDTIEQNPTCWAAYNNLGNVFLERGDLERAAKCFVKTIQIRPDHFKAYHNLGKIYASPSVRQPDKAAHCFQRAIDLGLRHKPAYDWLSDYYRRREKSD